MAPHQGRTAGLRLAWVWGIGPLAYWGQALPSWTLHLPVRQAPNLPVLGTDQLTQIIVEIGIGDSVGRPLAPVRHKS
jgi:hypothetical protein